MELAINSFQRFKNLIRSTRTQGWRVDTEVDIIQDTMKKSLLDIGLMIHQPFAAAIERRIRLSLLVRTAQ